MIAQKWRMTSSLPTVRHCMAAVERIPPGPGQESVWDYPRPPTLEPVPARLRVEFAGVVIADTQQGWRVLETSHPPTYYLPLADVVPDVLQPAEGSSVCEWKGVARYYDVVVGIRRARRAAWAYPHPRPRYAALAELVGFMPALMDRCLVGDEVARPQPGGFYGGWITDAIVGPFKGQPGTMHW